MINRFANHRNDDDGVALVFVMIFLVIVGALISVGLSKSEGTTLAGEQLRDRTQLQYALDAGINRGIQALRSDIANQTPANPASLCPTTSGSSTDITSSLDGSGMALNGWTIGYSCQTLGGQAADPNPGFNTNYAILTTDTHSGALTTQSGSSSPLVIGGSIYLEGPDRNSDVKKPLLVQSDISADVSNAAYSDEDDCNAQLNAVTQIQLDPTVTGSLEACTEQTLAQAMPNVVLPTAPTTDVSGAALNGIDVPTLSGSCRVFFPGLYTADPNLDTHGSNYFVSGLYYMKQLGSWSVANGSDVIAGQRNPDPASTDSPVPASSECAAMTDRSRLRRHRRGNKLP